MLAIIEKIHGCWERVLCAIMAVLFIVCVLTSVLFLLKKPQVPEIKGRKPVSLRIFPWDSLSGNFFTPSVPGADKANPFHYVLVNHLKPAPKPIEPVKPVQKKPVVESKVETQVRPPEKKEPPPPPRKPDLLISVTYKGFYVDVRGDIVALVAVAEGDGKKEETLMCKIGNVLCDRIRLDNVADESATFSSNGTSVIIKWMQRHQFRFER